MSPRTAFLCRLIGLYCILGAVSLILRGNDLIGTISMLMWDSALVFFIGAVTLAAGLAIVLTHNIWSNSFAIIVSVIGWLTVVKGMLFLTLTPERETRLFLEWLHYQDFFYFYSVFSVAIGLYLLYGGFKKSS